jgi:hypothetical protein
MNSEHKMTMVLQYIAMTTRYKGYIARVSQWISQKVFMVLLICQFYGLLVYLNLIKCTIYWMFIFGIFKMPIDSP